MSPAAWATVAAVVLLAQGALLVWMLRDGVRRLTAQVAVLTVVVHEVLDKLTELDEELHAVDEGRK